MAHPTIAMSGASPRHDRRRRHLCQNRPDIVNAQNLQRRPRLQSRKCAPSRRGALRRGRMPSLPAGEPDARAFFATSLPRERPPAAVARETLPPGLLLFPQPAGTFAGVARITLEDHKGGLDGRWQRCPYCAEEIRSEATRRYCRSRLTSFASDRWHRAHPERLGVCAGLAHAFAECRLRVRIAFVCCPSSTWRDCCCMAHCGWRFRASRARPLLERLLHLGFDLASRLMDDRRAVRSVGDARVLIRASR